jgi:heat shock protein HtpX
MYSQIAANKRKTVAIMVLFIAFIGGLAWIFTKMFGYPPSIFIGTLIGGAIYALISYFVSSKLALAVNGAKQIAKKDSPRLWRTVENLAITEGLPMPKVYLVDDPAPNAFATGRNPDHSSVAVTTGLLDILEDSELEGVIAHELGHIKNYDIRVSMMAFALVSIIGLMADVMLRLTWFRDRDDDSGGGGQLFFIIGLIAAILAPLAATLIQLAISRQREYLADATGALATRYPEGLAGALKKIGEYGSAVQRQNSSTAHLYFANPLRGTSVASLFSTHPPIADRIRRLTNMETEV